MIDTDKMLDALEDWGFSVGDIEAGQYLRMLAAREVRRRKQRRLNQLLLVLVFVLGFAITLVVLNLK
jgi:hypothetical protein